MELLRKKSNGKLYEVIKMGKVSAHMREFGSTDSKTCCYRLSLMEDVTLTVATIKDMADARISNIIKSNGAFCAFSREQFEENMSDDSVPYKYQEYSGLFVPAKKYRTFLREMGEVSMWRVEFMLENIGKKDLIMYELGNYESHFTDHHDAFNALESYGITKDEVIEVFNKDYIPYCQEHDLF